MRALLLGIALLFAGPAAAQSTDCERPQGKGAEYECALDAYDAADAELNRIWPQARKAMQMTDRDIPDATAEKDLMTAQRARIAYRDATCGSEAWIGGDGQMAAFIRIGCLQTETERRIETLNVMADLL